MPVAVYLSEPMHVFAYLVGALALVFWISTFKSLSKLFTVIPPVIWAYFLPMLSTTFGIIPADSEVYGWITKYLLPFSLFLLMISVDIPAILKLGWQAIVMFLAGTLGIVIGGTISYLIFGNMLPQEAWKEFVALSGSWIGGTANMNALAESVGTQNLGSVIVVDTVVGYGWMGILLFISGYQAWYDKKYQTKRQTIDELESKLEIFSQNQKPITMPKLAILIGLGFVATVLGIHFGDQLPTLGDPTIVSHTTWAILLVVTAGLILSFTKIRDFEEVGASKIGYLALYILIAAIGAQGDLNRVIEAPVFLLAGVVWMLFHIGTLFFVARLIKAPLFFVATGSMANVGGAASAPVVASVYSPALAPVGLLMAVAGYAVGIYAGLAFAWILSVLAV